MVWRISYYLVGAAVILLVAASAFLDDLLEGRTLQGPDLLLGVILALTAALFLLMLDRVGRSRLSHQVLAESRRGDLRALHALGGRSEAMQIFERAAGSACARLGGTRATVTIHSNTDPGSATVAAAAGPGAPPAGTTIPVYHGVTQEALRCGRSFLLDESGIGSELLGVDRLTADSSSAAIAPLIYDGAVQGLFAVVRSNGQPPLDDDDLDALNELSELCSLAVGQTRLRERAERTLDTYVEALSRALDARDSYTGRHSVDVVALAHTVGTRMGLDEKGLTTLGHTAQLHDIGKLGVPDAILHKPAPLDEEEWRTMKLHPVWGSRLLTGIDQLEVVAEAVHSEHEHWDGSGYPEGLAGEDIPLASRIVLVCDAFHAMISERPYRPARSVKEALDEIRHMAGRQFDPAAAESLVAVVDEGNRVSPISR